MLVFENRTESFGDSGAARLIWDSRLYSDVGCPVPCSVSVIPEKAPSERIPSFAKAPTVGNPDWTSLKKELPFLEKTNREI
mgnify:CR=1